MLAAKMAPAAGPDSTRRTGKRMAVSMLVMPLPEVISSKGQAKPARHQRRWQIDVHVVLLEAILVPDLHHIAKAFRGEKRGPGAFALDQRIGRKRGPVNDQPDLIRRNPRLGGDGAECRQDTFLRHRRCGQSLGGKAALAELESYIGER